MIVFPNAKINIGLNITGKRADGYHNLETIFYPINLKDALEVVENTELKFSYSGLTSDLTDENNICLQAYQLLKDHYPFLPPVHFHLHKGIPVGAGLGGGSSDAAFCLSLLNNKFDLGISKQDLLAYAFQLGSDCPFFVFNTPCVASGRGEMLKEVSLNLSTYKILIVNPGIPINTGWAFSQVHHYSDAKDLTAFISQPPEQWRNFIRNDFEEFIFKRFPEIEVIKNDLYNHGALYASLSGSGSTVYGIFNDLSISKDNFSDKYFVRWV